MESTESIEAIDSESSRHPCDPSLQKVLDQLEALQHVTDSIAFGQNRIELIVCQIQNEIQNRAVRRSAQTIHTDPMNSSTRHSHHNVSPDFMCRSSWTKNPAVLTLEALHHLQQPPHHPPRLELPDDEPRKASESTSMKKASESSTTTTLRRLPVIRQRAAFDTLPTNMLVTRACRTEAKHRGVTSKKSWMFPLHPDSKFRTALDITGIVSLLYDSISVPYQLAWEAPYNRFRAVMAWVMALFWASELLLGFVTGYQRLDHVQVEMDMQAIFKQYVKSLDFILNLVAVIADWTNVIIESLMANWGGSSRSLLRFVRMVKLTKALRVAAVLRAGKMARVREHLLSGLRRWGIDDQIYFVESLLRLLFLILWMNHVGGCIWYVTGKTASHIWYLDNIAEEAQGLNLVQANADEYQYLLSVYWSITSMFSGASIMSPTNSSELYLTIFYIIFGTLFGSSLISSMAAMLMDLQMTNKERQERLKELRKYLYQHRVDAMLAVPIEKEVVARMAKQRPLAEKDVEALAHLSPASRCELWYTIYGPLIESALFFGTVTTVDRSLLKDICYAALSHTACNAGAAIFEYNEESKGAYIVSWGNLEYRSSIEDDCPAEVSCGQWISEITLWSEWKHQGWLDAATNAEVLTISPEGLLKVLARHPATAMLARDYSSAIMLAVQNSPPDSMTDLRLPLDHEIILPFMPPESRAWMSQGALDLMKQTWSFFRSRGMQELMDEVKGGKCDLVVDPGGNVTRCVSRVALRLLRTGDGRLLGQVGKCVKGRVEAECMLPGTKVRGGELPNEALQRLLRDKLVRLSTCVFTTHQVYSLDESVDSDYGLQTRYQRTTYHAELSSTSTYPEHSQQLRSRVQLLDTASVRSSVVKEGVSVGGRERKRWSVAMRGSARATRIRSMPSVFAGLEAFALPDEAHGDGFLICSWLTPEDFEWFSVGGGGEAFLKEWVSYLDVEAMGHSQMIKSDVL
mmetsp:Transcript_85494/g.250272  ORF Transcript_85494/g.250272 Transcript_85494/m.250272 type:complete len:972 (+) Transcript_85494:77-2992(+)